MDRGQFTANVKATQGALRRFLTALCCGDSCLADDIAQESYVKAYLSTDGLRDGAKFRSWIFRIAYTTFLNHRRAGRDMVGYEAVRETPGSETADGAFRYQQLYEALERIPAHERTSVLLYYMEGYSAREVAEITGATEETVRKHLSRGREHLRGLLSNK
ncbi:MAG: RNA polymerase sigma factor [Duncaniella sp.]|nr:RNA polymerase sigma factor [Duncaniella sp.]